MAFLPKAVDDLLRRLQPVFAGLVPGNTKVDVIEHDISRNHRFEGRNIDEAVSWAVCSLHSTRNGEGCLFEGEYRGGKFFRAADLLDIWMRPGL